MKPMKTLHFTNSYHPESGGIRTFYHALLDEAPRHQRFVRLVVPGRLDAVHEVNAFARIYEVRAPRSPVIDGRYRMLLPHRFLNPRSGRLWEILDLEQPDLVEICDKYSLPYFAGLIRVLRSQRPALVGLSCERMDDNVRAFLTKTPVAAVLARRYIRNIYVPQFDVHIANSEYTAAELELNPRHPRETHIRHMGVDTVTFTPARRDGARRAARRAALGMPPDAPLLVHAGRLSAEKGTPLLLDMMGKLAPSGAHLLLVGGGPLLENLRGRAEREHPGRVHFGGLIRSRGELADLLTDADLFVHPNPREPFGIAPLEAMSAGLPLVAPDRGGIVTYATAENAWLAPPAPTAFADAVVRALRDHLGRERRRTRALATAASCAWPAAAAAYFNIYDDIIERRSREAQSAVPVGRGVAGGAAEQPFGTP